MKVVAFQSTLQNLLNYILSAIFALLGMGMWSIILPGIIVAPLGTFIYHAKHTWRPTSKLTTARWSEIFNFGKIFLG